MKKVLSILLALSMILSCVSMVTFVVNAGDTTPVGFKITGEGDWYIVGGNAVFDDLEFAEGETEKTIEFTLYSESKETFYVEFLPMTTEGWHKLNGYYGDGYGALLVPGVPQTISITIPKTANSSEAGTNGINYTDFYARINSRVGSKDGAARAFTADDCVYIIPKDKSIVNNWSGGGATLSKITELPDTLKPAPGVKLEVTTTFDGGYYVFCSTKAGLTKEMAVDGNITKNFVVYNTSATDTMQIYLMYASNGGWTYLSPQVCEIVTINAGERKEITLTVPCNAEGKTKDGVDVSELCLRVDLRDGLNAENAIIIETENNPEVASLVAQGRMGDGTAGKVVLSTVKELPGQATPEPETTAEPTSEYVGKKLVFTSDVKSTLLTSESAGISGLSDGNHSIKYLVYNKGSVDVDVKMFLLNGTNAYNENDGTVVTIPKNEARYVTYDFVVENSLIKGAASSGAQEDAVLAFNIAMSESSDNGLGMIPIGTEVYFAYNRFDDKDAAKTLDDEHSATEVEDVKKLPAIGKKLTANVATEDNFWYVRANAGITSFVNGTHKAGYYVYNPNEFAITVNFYLQNDYATVNNNTGTQKTLAAGERAYLTYEYTVTDGAYFNAVATNMTIRFDVRPASGETSLPADTSIYIQYAGTPDTDPLKNIKSILVSGSSASSTISDMVFCPEYKPTAVIYTANKTVASGHYFITKDSGGLFTKDDIKDGKLVFEQYVFNECDYDITFYPAYHTVTTSGGWDGLKSGNLITVEKNSGAWLKASLAVNDDNTITVGGIKYPIESFFLRLYFDGEIKEGTTFAITTDENKVTNMLSPISNPRFTAKASYDSKYVAPDTTVDPTFHISSAFGSHMVLQRDTKVPVWGVSTYIGKEVTVTFKGQTKTTTVLEDGTWTVTFDSMPADKNPAELTATCNGKTHTYTDILVGDVFIIGGQSNADYALSSSLEYSSEYKQQLIESAQGNIRFFRQGKADAMKNPEKMNTPQYEPINGNVWTRENLGTANTFCAFGFFFGHKIYDEIDVPIGMIMVASAGSPLSQLMSKEAADKADYHKEESGIPVSGMYNALMSPFINMSFKGMLFYQGESEYTLAATDYGKYNEYLNTYVEDLREKNGSNFPFYYAQVGTYPELNFTTMGEQRAVMFDGLKVVKNSGMIVTMDMGARAGYRDTAHSPLKEPIGQRFAGLVLAKTYGLADENYVVSPTAQYAVKTADGIVVTFKNVGDGLKRIGQHETLSGFRAMTGPATYVKVSATILSENTVLVHTNGIDGVIGVAYGIEEICYTDYPEGNGDLTCVANLGNSEDLPAFAFKMLVEDKIVGAQTNIGKDLTVNIHSTAQGQLKVYREGKETIIYGEYENGSYVYKYEGINPQCMGDNLTIELWVNGEKVDEKTDYSIVDYCNNLYNKVKSDGNINEKDKALLNLLADMLDFGAAAQNHMNYKTDSLINTFDWVEEYRTEFVKPESVRDVTTTTNADYKFKSVGLRIDNYVSIYVKFNVASWDKVTVKVANKTYIESDLVNGVLYLDDLSSTQYGDKYIIELVVDGVTVQTLTYSANSYIATMYEKSEISALVKAMGRYGASALSFDDAQ